MTLMCGIEGLPCVRVTGDEHAWNKVYVDGKWYISDATFGDTIILKDDGAYSVLTHAYFLTSEAIAPEYSNADTYTSRDYDAPTDWGYYFRLGRVVTAADEPALIAELRAAQAATNAPSPPTYTLRCPTAPRSRVWRSPRAATSTSAACDRREGRSRKNADAEKRNPEKR